MTANPPRPHAAAPSPPDGAAALGNVYLCFEPDGAALGGKLARMLRIDRTPPPGSATEARDRIEAADYFVFVVTPASAASRRCLDELGLARDAGKQLRFLVDEKAPADVQLPGMRPDNTFRAGKWRTRRALRALARNTGARLHFDAFISYAHEDAAFVGELVGRLRAAGRKVWLDRSNIEHAEPWREAIRSAIEAADAFVFVTTPRSLVSEECRKELDHAETLGKRIIPLPGEDTNPERWPPALRELNQDTGDLPPGDLQVLAPALLDLLDSEPGHVRTHTRLLVRAVEWEHSPRDPGRLLWLTELLRARVWLVSARGRKPAPTPLHRRYIRWSTASNAGVLAVLALVVALAVRSDAGRRAEERERRAGNLALLSRATAASQPDVALLLGVAAMDLHDGSETRAALFAALARAPRLLAQLRGHEGTPSKLAFAPDGRTLLAGSDPGSVTAWETAVTAVGRRVLREPRSAIQSLAVSREGVVAHGVLTGAIVLHPLRGGPSRSLALPVDTDDLGNKAEDFATALAFDPAGGRLLAGTNLGRLLVWDVASGRLLHRLRPPEIRNELVTTWARGHTAVAFARDGEGALAFSEFGYLVRWSLRDTTARVDRMVANEMAASPAAAFTAGGDTLAVVFLDSLQVYRTATLERVADASAGCGAGLMSAAFDPAGGTVAVGAQNGQIRLFGIARREWIDDALLAHTQEVDRLAFAPDGRTLASAGRDGRVLLWDVEGRRSLRAPIGPLPPEADAVEVAAGPGGVVHLGAGGGYGVPGSLESFRPGVPGPTAAAPLGDTVAIRSLVSRGAGESVAAGVLTRRVFYEDGDSYTLSLPRAWRGGRMLVPPLADSLGEVRAMALRPDGRQLAMALAGDEGLVLWDLGAGRPATLADVETSRGLTGIAYSRDGRWLAAESRSHRVTVWSLESGAVVDTMATRCTKEACGVALSPDGTLLAHGEAGGVVVRETGARPRDRRAPDRRLTGPRRPPAELRFSPDGRLLAATVIDGGARLYLWELATGTLLGDLALGSTRTMEAPLAFDPAGTVLVTGGSFPAAWEMDPRKWRARACAIAGNQELPAAFASLAGGRARPCAAREK